MALPAPAVVPRRWDVLYVGAPELPELREMEEAGLSVGRAPSVVTAVERLCAHGAAVAVVHASAAGADESRAFAALRAAGAGGVVCVYPPSLAWRAQRACPPGADAVLALPAPPGAVAHAATRLAAPRSAPPAATPALPPPPAAHAAPPPASPRSPWLESVVADIATMNRTLDDVDRLLDRVVTAFQRHSAAERCSVLLADRATDALLVRRTTGRTAPAAAHATVPSTGLAAHVARSGRPLLVADVGKTSSEVPGWEPDPSRSYRSRACLLLPLRGAEEVIGVVCLADRRGGAPFREADVPPLEFLALQAGQAIENGLRMRQLQELAAVDELTGLANRRQFQAALEREVLRARRYDRQLTLAILDLDHFKQFNDLCGHQAGDAALSAVGEILRTSLREVDVVARYGGEEFAVILPETAARPSGAARNPFPFLERLRQRVEAMELPGEDERRTGRLTISGGVACYPDDAVTVEELIREADRALYVSKSRGRNTITYRGATLTG